jgi:hypothetical protein
MAHYQQSQSTQLFTIHGYGTERLFPIVMAGRQWQLTLICIKVGRSNSRTWLVEEITTDFEAALRSSSELVWSMICA